MLMDEAFKREAVFQMATLLRENYVFPDIAEKLADMLLDNHKKGCYSEATHLSDFTAAIQEDLQHLSKDKHLDIWTDEQLLNELREGEKETQTALYLEWARKNNFGFVEAKTIEDEIGYLRFDGFFDTAISPEVPAFVAKTMATFQKARALIIDLRENAGGSPDMVQLISSYLFDEKPVHLNSIYKRATNEETHYWTLSNIEGKRYPDIPVFILTSQKTFSAAEEFTYNLQQLKRATMIGETTGGGAHPGEFRLIQDQFALFIPSGRAINPITKTNWEGVGVKPDVEVSASEALEVALALARREFSR